MVQFARRTPRGQPRGRDNSPECQEGSPEGDLSKLNRRLTSQSTFPRSLNGLQTDAVPTALGAYTAASAVRAAEVPDATTGRVRDRQLSARCLRKRTLHHLAMAMDAEPLTIDPLENVGDAQLHRAPFTPVDANRALFEPRKVRDVA